MKFVLVFLVSIQALAATPSTFKSKPLLIDSQGDLVQPETPSDDTQLYGDAGMIVEFSRILQGALPPPAIVIQKFDILLANKTKENLTVLAATAAENKTEESRVEATNRRARIICEMTKTYPYVQEISTDAIYFDKFVIDVAEQVDVNGYKTFATLRVPNVSGARHFTEIKCGQTKYVPRSNRL